MEFRICNARACVDTSGLIYKNNLFARFVSLNIVIVLGKMCKQDKLYKAAL